MPPKKAAPKPGGKLAALKAQMQAKKDEEERLKREEEEEIAREKEEERLLAMERKLEEEEKERAKAESKVEAKVSKAAKKVDKKFEALERMRAAGMVVPDMDVVAGTKAVGIERKEVVKVKKVVEVVEAVVEEEEDDLCDDWEAQMELEERKEKEAEEKEAAEVAAAQVAEREAELADVKADNDFGDLRSPICCVLGHVDTGKTSLLDKIRRSNVQGGEAGGITQQIGATFFGRDNLIASTEKLNEKRNIELRVPGLLVIDTPGHESFTNLRSRGSSLCDISVLVVDIMHGIEPQTRESMRLLRERKCPFIVALNKVDRLLDWEAHENMDIEQTLSLQKPHVQQEFETRSRDILLQFSSEGFNSELYFRNDDIRKYVSVVPTSAKSGEGISDLLLLMMQLVQRFMEGNITYKDELDCTVLEVKPVVGFGTTIDVVLINGTLQEGQQIMVCGLNGPILTQIRALLTPGEMKELRVKGDYVHHQKLKAAIGVKISAPDLDDAIPGTPLYVVKPGDDIRKMQKEIMQDVDSVLTDVSKSGIGVTVQSSTLGALEALLSFLKKSNIPVSAIALGPLHKRHLTATVAMRERSPKHAVVLAFDVGVTKEAAELAAKHNVPIFSARIIYHLFDMFTKYVDEFEKVVTEKNREIAVFPVVLGKMEKIRNKDPIIVGAVVERGQLHVGTPLCVMVNGVRGVIGKVAGIEMNSKDVRIAKKGATVSLKIVSSDPNVCFGRHFDEESTLYSIVSRESLDALKASFRADMGDDDWKLCIMLKKQQKIM